MVEHGAEPNHKDADGEYPLHIAARHGYLEIGKALIEGKIPAYNVGVENNDGKTPIMIARKHNHLGFVQMLIAHGAIDAI